MHACTQEIFLWNISQVITSLFLNLLQDLLFVFKSHGIDQKHVLVSSQRIPD